MNRRSLCKMDVHKNCSQVFFVSLESELSVSFYVFILSQTLNKLQFEKSQRSVTMAKINLCAR